MVLVMMPKTKQAEHYLGLFLLLHQIHYITGVWYTAMIGTIIIKDPREGLKGMTGSTGSVGLRVLLELKVQPVLGV